jgi:hypothetical protein
LVGSLGGNRLLSWPRHVTDVNAAAKAAISTSARSIVVRIIDSPRLGPPRSAPIAACLGERWNRGWMSIICGYPLWVILDRVNWFRLSAHFALP